ncbi:MAG: DUF488 domain-containing protein [Pirellulales bacterium]|nr:DUF488 domain-containing protein [Pirellulales bacterium]
MTDAASRPNDVLWTIGHSNHPLETFLELLRRHEIEVLVDVRSSPYSSYCPHFNLEQLKRAVKAAAMQYLYLGDRIGGRAEGAEFYDDEGRVLYDKVAATAGFREGIERLLKGLRAYRVAILCGEEDPANCHRRLLIGRVLRERGVRLMHLRGDGREQSEAELAAEEKFQKTKGQLSLFETEDLSAWKSTQSVLPKNRPPNSSSRSAARESDG